MTNPLKIFFKNPLTERRGMVPIDLDLGALYRKVLDVLPEGDRTRLSNLIKIRQPSRELREAHPQYFMESPIGYTYTRKFFEDFSQKEFDIFPGIIRVTESEISEDRYRELSDDRKPLYVKKGNTYRLHEGIETVLEEYVKRSPPKENFTQYQMAVADSHFQAIFVFLDYLAKNIHEVLESDEIEVLKTELSRSGKYDQVYLMTNDAFELTPPLRLNGESLEPSQSLNEYYEDLQFNKQRNSSSLFPKKLSDYFKRFKYLFDKSPETIIIQSPAKWSDELVKLILEIPRIKEKGYKYKSDYNLEKKLAELMKPVVSRYLPTNEERLNYRLGNHIKRSS